ncbi:GIY-YIG nuclease family protein [Roseivivax sp. CAU 1761]
MFEFTDFLSRLGLPPENTRLLRHHPRGLEAWRRGKRAAFGSFASFQKKGNCPYNGSGYAAHFLPWAPLEDGTPTGLFAGITRVLDRWDWDGGRLPRMQDSEVIAYETGKDSVVAYDLEWIEEASPYAERVLIRWGAGTRAWSQWASRNSKEILEFRMQAQEPPFPGFSSFSARISEMPAFPQSWVGALSGVRGIYLLVADNGEQYVGSATGVDGMIGRWRSYLANGHGNNVLLKASGHKDYTVSILEIASPDMAQRDILDREDYWKAKLRSRAHGLNGN